MNYTAIQLIAPCRVVQGRAPSAHVSLQPGLLDRITRDGDVLRFEGAKVLPGTVVPWANVAAATEAPEPVKAKAAK